MLRQPPPNCSVVYTLDTEERRGLLQALLEEITVYREGQHLRLNFRFHFLGSQERTLRSCQSNAAADGADRLTMRELAFLHLWGQGLTGPEIAGRFEVGSGAVRQFAVTVRRKLGVTTVDAAVELTRDQIEVNLPFLPLDGRSHKRHCDQNSLTPTETLALECFSAGLGYREAATKHGVPINSVYNAAYTARRKLGAKTNEEAVAAARQMAILDMAGR